MWYFVGNVDYDPGPYAVIIPAEVTHVAFNVTIHDDDLEESDENFTISIDPSSLRRRVSVSRRVSGSRSSEVTVTIVDNDEGRINLVFYYICSCIWPWEGNITYRPGEIKSLYQVMWLIKLHCEIPV